MPPVGTRHSTKNRLLILVTSAAACWHYGYYSSNVFLISWRMEQLATRLKGILAAEPGKQPESDHCDALQNRNSNNRCMICSHIEGI